MPITFLFFLMFVLCALIGPLAILTVAWTMYSPQRRQLGYQGAKFGLVSALLFCSACEFLCIALADSSERNVLSVMVPFSAGFTVGIVVLYIWKVARQVLGPASTGDV